MVGGTPGAGNLVLGLGSFWPSMLMPSDKAHLVYPLLPKYGFILQETGYLHIQATKPDTVGKYRSYYLHVQRKLMWSFRLTLPFVG